MNIENVESFIMYNYSHMGKTSIIRQLILVTFFVMLDIVVWRIMGIVNNMFWPITLMIYATWSIFLLLIRKVSLQMRFIYEGFSFSLLAVLFLAETAKILFISNNSMYLFSLILILASVSCIVAIKMCRHRITVGYDRIVSQGKNLTIVSTLGAIAGIWFTRIFFAQASQSTIINVIFMILIVTSLLSSFSACICFYKVYLIMKYSLNLDVNDQR